MGVVNYGIAIGDNASSVHAGAVALGESVATTATQQVNIGTKRFFAGVPTIAPPDANLVASQFSVWVDESGNNLMFKVKYSGGTVKSGTVALA